MREDRHVVIGMGMAEMVKLIGTMSNSERAAFTATAYTAGRVASMLRSGVDVDEVIRFLDEYSREAYDKAEA